MTNQEPTATKGKSIIGSLGVLALVVFKYKVFIITFGISLGAYALRYGWPWATALIALLFVHEMGHYIFMKAAGLNPKAPVFIPFVGAFVAMDKLPDKESTRAWSALAGPLLGGVTAVACFYIGEANNIAFLTHAAYFGILLNLLQLVPARPLDGGFVMESVAPWFRIPGAILLLLIGYLLEAWLLVIIGVISLFGGRGDDHFLVKASVPDKLGIFGVYIVLLIGLVCVWFFGMETMAPLSRVQ